MRTALAIARRDFAASFLSPTGYVVTALFLLLTGAFFVAGFQQGQTASMRPVFQVGTWILLFIGPAISMRMISEETRLGTIEMLMTAPVSEAGIILGKFVAGMLFLCAIMIPTGIYVAALELYGRPDYGELLCGYLGMVLAGTAYLASGILASTWTTSQAVAFLIALFFWLVLSVGAKLLPPVVAPPWGELVVQIDPDLRLRDFAIGLIDTSNIVYFLSFTVVFLAVAGKSLQTRRWR